MVILAETTGSTAIPQAATLVDWAVAYRSVQIATGGGDKAYRKTRETNGSCGPSDLMPPTAPDVDSGVLPDSETVTDGLTTPDEGTQPLPGWDQDNQSWGDSESQPLSQSASGSGRPIRTRRRPTALDAYILE